MLQFGELVSLGRGLFDHRADSGVVLCTLERLLLFFLFFQGPLRLVLLHFAQDFVAIVFILGLVRSLGGVLLPSL